MGKASFQRAWRRGWSILLTASQPGRQLPWRRRWLIRVRALADLPRVPAFRVGALLLVASFALMRALVWHYDLGGGFRDALVVLPVVAWAPWVARLYRRGLLRRLRTGRRSLAGGARRCSNSADEDPAETDLRRAGHRSGPGAGRDHRGAAVRRSERLSR